MPQQVDLEPPQARVSPRERARVSTVTKGTERANLKNSAKRLFGKIILSSLFAIGVVVGLVYLVNSEAFQSTDDAFIDGHIILVSSKVAGQARAVHVNDNQTVNKGDVVVELDSRDFDAAARQKIAALESTQAQATAAQAGLNEASRAWRRAHLDARGLQSGRRRSAERFHQAGSLSPARERAAGRRGAGHRPGSGRNDPAADPKRRRRKSARRLDAQCGAAGD